MSDGKPHSSSHDGTCERQPAVESSQSIPRVPWGVIEQIRKEFGDVSPKVAHGYRSMLEKIGVEIYSHATHFISEIVQNADDNSYSHFIEPNLSFEASHGRVVIQCNEVGFSTENVQAICDIDKSTKKKSKDSIGEKGIGFKSVFKVADSIHIYSNGFEFVLDKNNGPFGMVMPVWKEYPDSVSPPHDTILHLNLSSTCDVQSIYKDLEGLKPTTLLFLRKLARISISTPGLKKLWKDGSLVDDESESYYITYHSLNGVPKEPRRPDATRTEISLAFPMSSDRVTRTHNVHAFLPIRDYGFKFLIHADFLLIASREDIDASNTWNKFLRQGIVGAFERGIEQMNRHPRLRFIWIRYLPETNLQNSFLSPLGRGMQSLIGNLSGKEVLWSQTGHISKPSTLIYVPPEYRTRRNTPFHLAKVEGRDPLSFGYAIEDMPILKELGVTQMTQDMFLRRLKNLGDLSSQNPEWHEDLAKVLLRVPTTAIADLRLIPLEGSNSSWVSGKELESNPVYETQTTDDVQLPPCIDLRFVGASAAKSQPRSDLFRMLGVKPCNYWAICDAIIRSHKLQQWPPTVQGFALQVKYLFRHRNLYHSTEIMLHETGRATLNGFSASQYKGYELYFDDPRVKYPVSQLLKDCLDVKYLNKYYLRLDSDIDQDQYFDWLIKVWGLAVIPRIVQHHRQDFLYSSATKEFTQWVTKSSLSVLIDVIIENWQQYAQYLSLHENALKSRLAGKILPLPELVARAETFTLTKENDRFLQITVPEHQRGTMLSLSRFGVVTALNVEFYLLLLRWLRDTNMSNKLPHANNIYIGLASFQAPTDQEAIRNAFAKDNLVFQKLSDKWVNLRDCIWNGPSYLWFNHPVSKSYNCGELFCDILKIQREPKLETFVDELYSVSRARSQQSIQTKLLLLELSKHVKRSLENQDRRLQSSLASLKEATIFPVREKGGTSVKLVDCTRMSASSYNFIPDRADLYSLFKDKVSLLDFSVNEVQSLMPLISNLLPSYRLLSKEVRKIFLHEGEQTLNGCLTDDFQSKSLLLLRCFRHYAGATTLGSGRDLFNRLRNIQVLEIERLDCVKVIYEHEQGRQNFPKVSVLTSGDAMLENCFEHLRIFISRDKTLQKKALCHTIPECLVQEFGLSREAQRIISTILQLPQSLSSEILDEQGLARLPEEFNHADATPTVDSSAVQTDSRANVARGPLNLPQNISSSVDVESLNCAGTGWFPFEVYIEQETTNNVHGGSVVTICFQSITFMSPYRRFSFEELRLGDYARGHKYADGIPNPGAFGVKRWSPAIFTETSTQNNNRDTPPSIPFNPPTLDPQRGLPIATCGPSDLFANPTDRTIATPGSAFGHPRLSVQSPESPSSQSLPSAANPAVVQRERYLHNLTDRSKDVPATRQPERAPRSTIPHPRYILGSIPTSGLNSHPRVDTSKSSSQRSESRCDDAQGSQSLTPSATDTLADTLTGSAVLHRSMIAQTSSYDFDDVKLISTETLPYTPSTIPGKDHSQYYPHTTIAFLGELFAVSILTKFLPNFNASQNWTSRLRTRAKVCDGFKDIPPYEERDTSTIMYIDSEGAMARWLVYQGYWEAEEWVNEKRKFYIDVKTTIRDCTTPFTMSSAQTKHAKRWTQRQTKKGTEPQGQQEEDDTKPIYLIIRAFHILEECRNLCVYMDPHALVKAKRLEIHAKQYTVTSIPGAPSNNRYPHLEDSDSGSSGSEIDEAGKDARPNEQVPKRNKSPFRVDEGGVLRGGTFEVPDPSDSDSQTSSVGVCEDEVSQEDLGTLNALLTDYWLELAPHREVLKRNKSPFRVDEAGEFHGGTFEVPDPSDSDSQTSSVGLCEDEVSQEDLVTLNALLTDHWLELAPHREALEEHTDPLMFSGPTRYSECSERIKKA